MPRQYWPVLALLLIWHVVPAQAGSFPGGGTLGQFSFPAATGKESYYPGLPPGVRPAMLGIPQKVRLWSSGTGGRSSLAGEIYEGTSDVKASVMGGTVGIDAEFSDTLLAGFSFGLSHQTFASGNGLGSSADNSITFYARQTFLEQIYLTGALGFGWHKVKTSRTAGFFSENVLSAGYHAQDFGGRVEGGYVFVLENGDQVAPFAAFVGDLYHQPAYAETAESGSDIFAASFAARTFKLAHLEIGARYGRYFSLGDDQRLAFDAQAAWEREIDDSPYLQVSFLNFSDSSFALRGTQPARDSALLGLGARFLQGDRLSFGLRADGRFGAGTTIYSGTADVTFQW